MLSRVLKQRFIHEFLYPQAPRFISRNPIGSLSYRFMGAFSGIVRRFLCPAQETHDRWHSWDATPWQHPWQSPVNISTFKSFSDKQIELARRYAERFENTPLHIGAVCNMANNIYQRLPALSKLGADATLYQHPQDTHVMSFPAWEEFNGTLSTDEIRYENLKEILPQVSGVQQLPVSANIEQDDLDWMRLCDAAHWPEWQIYNAELCRSLQKHDVLWATQSPYLAYLSNRPYVVTQSGGDAWFDCSRNDSYGHVQRHSFGNAAAFFANNPWSLGFARRYGWGNLLYLPFYLDDEKYIPGFSACRKKWEEQTGGDFFILSTSRLSASFKGNIDLRSILRTVFDKHPNVRLVQTVWGDDAADYVNLLKEEGILNKVLLLPLSGKKRVVQYLQAADCLLDQFQVGYMGATALEAMGCGVPVIMRLETAQYEALVGARQSPICHAGDHQDVLDQLLRLIEDKPHKYEAGVQHRAWFMEHHSAKMWAPVYRDVLRAVANGFKFDFSRSPLQSKLSQDEEDYHRQGLEAAPEFPSYIIS